MTISERIRLIRQQKSISQNELAKAAGINVKSLSRYELGASIPPANALKAIADALGVSADALLTDDNAQIKDKELFKKISWDMPGLLPRPAARPYRGSVLPRTRIRGMSRSLIPEST